MLNTKSLRVSSATGLTKNDTPGGSSGLGSTPDTTATAKWGYSSRILCAKAAPFSVPGMSTSVTTKVMSGRLCRMSQASSAVAASITESPVSTKTSTVAIRTSGSSSTTRIWYKHIPPVWRLNADCVHWFHIEDGLPTTVVSRGAFQPHEVELPSASASPLGIGPGGLDAAPRANGQAPRHGGSAGTRLAASIEDTSRFDKRRPGFRQRLSQNALCCSFPN